MLIDDTRMQTFSGVALMVHRVKRQAVSTAVLRENAVYQIPQTMPFLLINQEFPRKFVNILPPIF